MRRLMMATVLAMAVGGCAVAAEVKGPSGVSEAGATRVVRVESWGELQKAVDGAVAGEKIVVADGKYVSERAVKIECAGAAGRPVVIAAEHVGGVEVSGKAGVAFGEKASWVVVEGFVFTHAMVPLHLPAGTTHLRVTRNVFALANDKQKGERPDVEVSGDDCEVDHNTFRDKATEGPMVTVQGPGKDGMAQWTWIHHNLFSNFMPTANNCSAIQIGLSWRSMTSAHSLTEHNLFVKCHGENEGAICNKSCENVYRYNTFAEGTRELSLRHGNGCEVYGNYFLNTDGLRFFGHDHKIYSNYFQGCTPAIHVGNGDATIPPGKLQMHDEPVGVVVAFNTLVENKRDIVMAARKEPYGATGVTIADNVIVGGEQAAAIEGPLTKSVWVGNVVWKTGLGTMPAEGAVVRDPGLVKGSDGVWHVGGSGVAAVGIGGKLDFVKVDLEGRRGVAKVAGAEQVGGKGVSGVLTEKEVGPGAE